MDRSYSEKPVPRCPQRRPSASEIQSSTDDLPELFSPIRNRGAGKRYLNIL